MLIPPELLEEARSRVPLSRLIARAVKLKRAGRQWQGLCPFHEERTPSFYVDDVKGFHCHGCGVGGDHVSWLRKRQGLGFREAAEALLREAGLELPPDNPHAIKERAHRLTLMEILGEAQRWLRRQLGGEALAYLRGRGITDDSIERFGFGYQPKTETTEGLGALLKGRLTLPIKDLQGRVVAFAGRALTTGVPKYLNSADSDVWVKGESVYNAAAVRQPVHDGAELWVCEGYLDVVQCTQAGAQAVATMGTSITLKQLLSLWRLASSPTLLLDGDTAGRRAAGRVINLALPALHPGRSLRVALLPSGMDPDEVIRKRGPEALQRAAGAALSLPDAYWSLNSQRAATLEERAALEASLIAPLMEVPDRDLRFKWIADVRDRIRASAKRQPVVRANGHSHHSAAPGSIRLVNPVEVRAGISLKEAVLIAQALREEIPEHALVGLTARTLRALEAIAQGEYDGDATQEALAVCRAAGITTVLPEGDHARGAEGSGLSEVRVSEAGGSGEAPTGSG
jgi:DNA primase